MTYSISIPFSYILIFLMILWKLITMYISLLLISFHSNGWNISHWHAIWYGNTTHSTLGRISDSFGKFQPLCQILVEVYISLDQILNLKKKKTTNSGRHHVTHHHSSSLLNFIISSPFLLLLLLLRFPLVFFSFNLCFYCLLESSTLF